MIDLALMEMIVTKQQKERVKEILLKISLANASILDDCESDDWEVRTRISSARKKINDLIEDIYSN